MIGFDEIAIIAQLSVIPAKAGIQYSTVDSMIYWIPACAGMTKRNVVWKRQTLPTEAIRL